MSKSRSQILKEIKGNWTVAEIEIKYKPVITECKTITSSSSAYELVKTLWNTETIYLQENFAVLFFNTSKKIIGWRVLSTGTMNKCIVDVKLLVSLALHCMCTEVMIVHNHPSGNLNPSVCDKDLTLTIKTALKIIDVNLLDHLIITEERYYSFSDEGLL